MIIIPVLAKQPLNVHWTVSVKHLNAIEHAGVAVIDYSDDNKAHAYMYDTLDALSDETSKNKTFDETTEVYKNASAVYSADGFNSTLEVIEIPKDGSTTATVDHGTVTETPAHSASVSAGSVSESPANPVEDAMLYNLDSNVAYVVPTKNVSEKDVETITDTLFDNRAGVVVYQTSSKDDMHSFANHIQSTQSGKFGNAYGIFEDRPLYPAAQAAGYGYAHVPCDFMKIGNESEFEPTDLTFEQVKDVLSCNFNVVENKADDFMFATDLSVNGSYIDQFANVKYIVNDLTVVLQRYLNRNETPYNDLTLHCIKSGIKTEIKSHLAKLFMGMPTIHVATRSEVSNADVEKRLFRDLSIDGTIFGDIQNIDGKLNITA